MVKITLLDDTRIGKKSLTVADVVVVQRPALARG
jgi:hypothetical protein